MTTLRVDFRWIPDQVGLATILELEPNLSEEELSRVVHTTIADILTKIVDIQVHEIGFGSGGGGEPAPEQDVTILPPVEAPALRLEGWQSSVLEPVVRGGFVANWGGVPN